MAIFTKETGLTTKLREMGSIYIQTVLILSANGKKIYSIVKENNFGKMDLILKGNTDMD